MEFILTCILFFLKSNSVHTTQKELRDKKFSLWQDILDIGANLMQISLVQMPCCIWCPVRAYSLLLKSIIEGSDSPLFMLPHNQPLTYRLYQLRLKKSIQKLNQNLKSFLGENLPHYYLKPKFRKSQSSSWVTGDRRYLKLSII